MKSVGSCQQSNAKRPYWHVCQILHYAEITWGQKLKMPLECAQVGGWIITREIDCEMF